MVEQDLGQATIAYEDPDEGTVEKTVQNEHVAYFQDHWIVKTGEDDSGNDVVRRIPAQRVHYVERSIEAFEEEVRTLRDQVQSVADDLRSKLLGGGSGGGGGGGETGRQEERGEPEVVHIDVESGESATGAGEESGSRSGSGPAGESGQGSGSTGTDEGPSGQGDSSP